MSKKRKQIKKRPEAAPVPSERVSRRKFLAVAAGSITLSALAYVGITGNSKERENWDFLNQPIATPNSSIPYKTVMEEFASIQPEGPIMSESKGLKVLAEKIKEHIAKLEEDPRNLSAKLSEQHYARPSRRELTEQTARYVRLARDHLYERISGLKPFDLETILINKKEDVKDTKNKAFIGEEWTTVYRAYLLKENRLLPNFVYVAQRNIGCRGVFNFVPDTNDIKEYNAFISTNKFALLGPFSEFLPYTTQQTGRKYEQVNDKTAAILANETFVEGASRILASEIVKELSVPNGEMHLRSIRDMIGVSPMYRHVNHAERWLEQNGLQKGFDLYMESPEKFMQAIGAKD